jgi:hypothetical protein
MMIDCNERRPEIQGWTRRLVLGAAAGLLLIPLSAQERVTLTTAETKPSNTQYTVAALHLDWTAQSIVVEMTGVNGERLTKAYTPTTTPTGSSLLVSLNKANLTTRSLNQRIFDRLILDGVLVGTVAGTVP